MLISLKNFSYETPSQLSAYKSVLRNLGTCTYEIPLKISAYKSVLQSTAMNYHHKSFNLYLHIKNHSYEIQLSGLLHFQKSRSVLDFCHCLEGKQLSLITEEIQ